ncbi:MAG: AAA family ATPase [Acidobacteriota bacterium]|nr:MAG: AAA family ATPase [Acidobacteriota bacterium]
MTTKKVRELDVSELRCICDPESLPCDTTDELEPLQGIIGQERALRAIQFGLRMRSFGYNLFVAGSPGTGKKTLIRSLVEEIASQMPTPNDLVYVYNFDRPERPRAIEVPPGVASRFAGFMESLISTLVEEVPKAFKSEDFESRRSQIIQEFQITRAELTERVQVGAKERGLAVKSVGNQIITVPVLEGTEISPDQFNGLSEEVRAEIQKNQIELGDQIQETYRQIRILQQTTQEKLKDLDRTVAMIATGRYIDELRSEFKEHAELLAYLEEVQHDIIDNIGDFLDMEEDEEGAEGLSVAGSSEEDALNRYAINVIVDNSKQQGAPVITENHPTFRNLIGYSEREARMGTLHTDFTLIRPGSILAANHGFLILDLIDLLSTPMAWDALKRVLQAGEVSIQDPTDQYGLVATLGLRPSPVKVDLKVIVLGSAHIYNQLYAVDEDFQKLFKIRAEFDTVMKKNSNHLIEYARFIKTLCDKEQLRHFDRGAVAALVEHSSRMVSDKTRLTLRFSDVADLIRESDYWARENSRSVVIREDVKKAISEKAFRSNLFEERLQEMIDEGSIMIGTAGEVVGQINGLSVYQIGDYSFGKPTRLTAQTSVGEKGVVNVEREARMSGNIHDKGVLILSGYLQGKYGQQRPLSLNASICFEQSYSGVDGDSASSTELYAIVSSLAEAPLKQSIAVTGSINQKGQIQPIGGVNEKIEGFFDTCEAAGLTGDQGVIIPHQNVQNLVLHQRVIDAVREGKFHIYPVETVDQGLEILTGCSAGEPSAEGGFPADTLHGKVQLRLSEMADMVERKYRGSE